MNYTEITQFAQDYTDRYDSEVQTNMPLFLKMIEAKLNRMLEVAKMASRTVLLTIKDREYYSLPNDFGGLRDIEIQDTPSGDTIVTNRETLSYLSPEQMNEYVTNLNSYENAKKFYTIIADNQVHIYPPQEGKVLEIVYYKNIKPLTSADFENWVSTDYPDVYIYGLCQQINAFIKDPAGSEFFKILFLDAVNDIIRDDKKSRWSGTALQMRST